MLVSEIPNNDYGYINLEIKSIPSEPNDKEFQRIHQQDLYDKGIAEKKRSHEIAFNEYCGLLLGRCKVPKESYLPISQIVCNGKPGEENHSSSDLGHQKTQVGVEWNGDEGSKSIIMDIIDLSPVDDKSHPAEFSSKEGISEDGTFQNEDSEKCGDDSLDDVNSSKCSISGLATTSRNISKMHLSTDEDTNFDIFDFMKCSDDEVAECEKSFCDKDELSLNEDLVNKYEKNLGLDIVKDKDICWAAGNFESDVCPLKSYDVSNENSLLSFGKESLDGDSRESFAQEWTLDESIDYMPQDHDPDPQVIVPKKAVDITKIKGWRKKQFNVEKCLANRNSVLKRSGPKLEESKEKEGNMISADDPNKDYAFVCDKLDDFLDQEAELKINYEIPHLYAEYGIKLTSEELVSRPKFNLSAVNKRLPVRNLSKMALLPKSEIVPSVNTNIAKLDVKPPRPHLVKKPSPKMKCAFPNKTHKNWNLWKENNLSKGKPMSLLKKEFTVKKESTNEVTQPCRRSGRISQAIINKANASPVLNGRVTSLTESDTPKPSFDFGTDYRFQIRKFGMVLYPGPSAPLNPFIIYHLRKIRSYRTLIDRKWANFAVSAVVQKGETTRRKRMVLPLTCCFKYKKEPAGKIKIEPDSLVEDIHADVNVEGIDKIDLGSVKSEVAIKVESIQARRRDSGSRMSVDSALTRKINEGKFDLYEEEVKCGDESKEDVEMFDSIPIESNSDNPNNFSDDSNFDSDKCDIVFEKRRSKTSISKCLRENLRNSPEVIDIEDDGTEFSSTAGLSPDASQTAFNRNIAKLLTKKLNELKQTENVTNSIDNLKTVKTNVLELIKLNFVKENYLSGYINLWYLKSPETGKSRIFLTFSMNPPVEGAINLKMMSRCSESDPPNIIQEIITKDKLFDPNDFAILYCDGKHWEIHGSVNFEVTKADGERDKSDKIQVFHLTKKVFPELEMLHDIKQRNDKTKVIKWWVMHMMQDYTEITVRCGDQVGRISRSIIIKTWKTKVPSFIEFKGLHNVRPIGVGVNPKLWPYFLIGPYYMGDHHNLTLKLNSKIVPFEYYLPLDRVKPAFLLKRFVSSVIMHSWRNCRQVVGMWLYDRIGMKQGSFIQVRTRVKKSGNYEPTTEHDYSLTKGKDEIFEPKMDCGKKVPDKNDTKPTTEVFLVPNVPHLGYIKGELHPDQSVTIEHPLKPERKRNSLRIGDWLNRIMKKRIKFVPSDFDVRWEVVKSAEKIQNLEPFNRSCLGGAHFLCEKGIFYLLSMTKEKIEKLGLDVSVITDAIANSPIIQEVTELKELGKVLLMKEKCDLPMGDVLNMALTEIDRLEKEEGSLKKSRTAVEKEREELCLKYLEALNSCEVDENAKRTIAFYVSGILESCNNKGGESTKSSKEKENYRRLKAINKFFRGKQFANPGKCADIVETGDPSTCSNEKISDAEDISRSENEKLRELESKIKSLRESLNKMTGDDVNLREMLTNRLNSMSDHLEKMKRSHNTNGKLSPVIADEGDSSGSQRIDSAEINDRVIATEEIAEEAQNRTGDESEGNHASSPERETRTKTQNALSILKRYVEEEEEEEEELSISDASQEKPAEKDEEPEVVILPPEGNDETDLNSLKNSMNLQKTVEYRLIRPISLGDGKSRTKVKDRIDYVDLLSNGKKVLLVNKKRKKAGRSDFSKRLRTT